MRQGVLTVLLILAAGFLCFSSRPITSQERYVDKFMHVAIKEMERSGIPASIKIAQALLESAAGKSELAINANNHFGIKCKQTWIGNTYQYKDDDKDDKGILVYSCFRMYQSAEESYIDHTEFLTNRERYKELFDYSKYDYESWAMGLKKCGYATDPTYAKRLIATIEKYNLNELDKKSSGEEINLEKLFPIKENNNLGPTKVSHDKTNVKPQYKATPIKSSPKSTQTKAKSKNGKGSVAKGNLKKKGHKRLHIKSRKNTGTSKRT
ncbi:MAG: glucosaminidase domain-containing protein [Bacteroidota bacterium]|nr:glucosaminidase domain-containing protein [Bacteroidota bacterium]